MSVLAVSFLVACILAYSKQSQDLNNHRISKRFLPPVYPKNGIIQFALGLGLPADVKGRNIATNSGILINIQLPTNVSELRPPQRSIRSTAHHRSFLQQVADMLDIKPENRDACLGRSMCILYSSRYQTSLIHDLFKALVDSIFDEEVTQRFFKRRKRDTRPSNEDCFTYNQECDSALLKFFDENIAF
ncbi:uncharacterized protein [Halyomorpha halys]|uniref:uncharacterized protein n=1 Tax=Halyomorpha halys TaxID=286706 RepID=UPI0006D4DD83|nr:uncharacterized protein LOC106681098 [Halyomorpha halys]